MKTGTLVGVCMVAVALAMGGCSREEPAKESRASDMDSLPPSAVLVRVNGCDFTKQDFEDEVALRMAIFRHKRAETDEKKLADARKGCVRMVMETSVAMAIQRSFAKDVALQADAPAVRAMRSRFYRAFRGRGDKTEAAFRASMEKLGVAALLDKKILGEACIHEGMRRAFTNELDVTDAMLAAEKEMRQRTNIQIVLTNQLIYAQATNLVRRARQGEDFAALADRHSQDKGQSPGGALGECDKDDFANDKPGVWEAIEKLQDGDVSDPVDSESGLTIFKMNRRIAMSELTDAPAYDLSRICLYRAIPYPALTDEELREKLRAERFGDCTKRLVREAMASARIEFPSGLQVFPKGIANSFRKYFVEKPEEVRHEAQ